MSEVTDKLFEQLRNDVARLALAEHELGNVRATLEVNLRPNSAFGHYGMKFDENKSTHDNMLELLRFCNARLLVLEDERATANRARNEAVQDAARLRRELTELKQYAAGHHAQEESCRWLHALTIDIPHMIDVALQP